MIANITTVLYILSVSDEIINTGTLQKGTAISRIDDDDGLQIYKYCNYLTASQDDTNGLEMTPFEEENIYLITGKFSVAQDKSINLTIIANVLIPLNKNDIPTMKPTVQLLGKAMNHSQLSEAGYTLEIQVKPYLSKEQFNPFLINLTHPLNGRFKNALTKVKKNSTIHSTGLLFFADKQIYCEILEFQFVGVQKETESSISAPWKTKTESSSSSSKSSIERRIDLVRQNLTTKAPSLPANVPSQHPKNKRESFNTKISDISKSLQDKQQKIIEVDDNNQEKNDIVEIEDNEETNENEEEEIPKRKSKRQKYKK